MDADGIIDSHNLDMAVTFILLCINGLNLTKLVVSGASEALVQRTNHIFPCIPINFQEHLVFIVKFLVHLLSDIFICAYDNASQKQ